MTSDAWFVLGVNPEPWGVGPLDVIRRGGRLTPTMGRNQQLDAYKEAVREELSLRYGASLPVPAGYELDFYFWRHRADYITPQAQKARKNEVDATNLQKATEDALQGILIGNDRDVIRVRSTIMAQGPYVHGAVVIHLRWGVDREEEQYAKIFPESVTKKLTEVQTAPAAVPAHDNSWPPRR